MRKEKRKDLKGFVVYERVNNNIAKSLREIIEREGISIYRVAKAIGVDFSSLYRALKDEGNVGAKTINKILDEIRYEIRLVKSKRKVVKGNSELKSRQKSKSI